MSSASYYRLLGYSATLVLHTVTFIDVKNRIRANSVEDQRVADFETLQIKFITIWTYCLQIVYAALGLSCDMLVLLSHEPSSLSKRLQRVRELMFSSLVWPTSLMIPVLFWPIYLLDPMLVFPTFIDKVLSSFNNQAMHTAVAFVVLWEFTFLPRSPPASHKLRLSIFSGYLLGYLFVLVSTYLERGHWMYPVLDKLHGTVFLYLIIGSVFLISLFFYFIQWPMLRYFHGKNKTQKLK